MNLKNTVYASALSTLAAGGCSTLPDLRNPDLRAQLEGTYKGMVDGHKVTYKVGKEGCAARVNFGLQDSFIIDHNCDNAADFMNGRDRKYLLQSSKAEAADLVLERTQEELVKPENKVK